MEFYTKDSWLNDHLQKWAKNISSSYVTIKIVKNRLKLASLNWIHLTEIWSTDTSSNVLALYSAICIQTHGWMLSFYKSLVYVINVLKSSDIKEFLSNILMSFFIKITFNSNRWLKTIFQFETLFGFWISFSSIKLRKNGQRHFIICI